jgi:phosphatidylglycerophosphate synthase
MHPVNRITFARFLFTAAFVVAIAEDLLVLGAFLAGVAYATDAIDGFVARKYGQMSRFGATLDYFADLTLWGAGYLALTLKDLPFRVPTWVCAAVLSYVVFHTVLWVLLITYGSQADTARTPRTAFGILVFFLSGAGLLLTMTQGVHSVSHAALGVVMNLVGILTLLLLMNNMFLVSYDQYDLK